METKYTLTIEQIQTIIENYKLGEYCKNNCYGCCGSDNYHSHCKDCVPKMKKHIEEMTSVTLEQVQKEWEELGFQWVEQYYTNRWEIHLLSGITEIIIYPKLRLYKCIDRETDNIAYIISFQEHQLLTKTFKAFGVDLNDPS